MEGTGTDEILEGEGKLVSHRDGLTNSRKIE